MSDGHLCVLVVHDRPVIPRILRASLSGQGYRVIGVQSGAAALDLIRTTDLMLLDLGRQDTDGLEVIQRAREYDPVLPIVVLSPRREDGDKIAALDAGADDYLTKPFGMGELLARIRAAQRHCLQQRGEKPLFRCGDLTVDLVRRRVTLRERELNPAPREYDLLRLLVAHAGKVVTHKQVLSEVWGYDADVQYIRIYVRALRRKIESDIEHPWYVTTQTGVGYRMRAPD